jgi:diacylglycerol kinase
MRNIQDLITILLFIAFVAITFFIKEEYLLRSCIFMAVTFLFLIIEAMNNRTKKIVAQQDKASRELHQVLTSIAMDWLNIVRKKKEYRGEHED